MLLINAALIGEYNGLVDVVFTDAEETVQGTVHLVVLTRLHLNGDDGQVLLVVDEIIHFAQLLIVIIEQSMSMCPQFLCHYRLID